VSAKGVKRFCPARSIPLNGVTGAKRGLFTVRIDAIAIKRVTFYVDGHKLRTFIESQARHGKFSIRIDPLNLKIGAHWVSFKAVPSDARCEPTSGSAPFVHPKQGTKPSG
jgi:hypothetical protein